MMLFTAFSCTNNESTENRTLVFNGSGIASSEYTPIIVELDYDKEYILETINIMGSIHIWWEYYGESDINGNIGIGGGSQQIANIASFERQECRFNTFREFNMFRLIGKVITGELYEIKIYQVE